MPAARGVQSSALVVALVTALVALIGAVAADARWLAALGGDILHGGAIPHDVPYAAAPTDGWSNVPVLAELAFHGLETGLGDRGLLLAQVVAVALAFSLLAWNAAQEGSSRAIGPLLVLVAMGSAASLIAVRAQLFSLVLFALLLALLSAEARRPSARVWLLVPVFALWSNLHGAVLVGLVVAAAYLLLDRARRDPVVACSALGLSALALGATPALARTVGYYRGVLGNEAAQRGAGLWAPLDPHHFFDLLLVLAAVPLLLLAVRGRPRLWELVALAALAVLTFQTARGGVWLLFAALAPATRAAGRGWMPARVNVALPAVFVLVAAVGVAKGPANYGVGPALVHEAIARADGRPVLAEDLAAEQVALEGGRVLVANPLDAFSRSDQREYLDWLEGRPGGGAALDRVGVVLVMRGSDAQRRVAATRGFREVGGDARALLYVRSAPA